jgi:hypothetical protein
VVAANAHAGANALADDGDETVWRLHNGATRCPGVPEHALGDAVLSLGLLEKIIFPGFRWHDAASDAIASLVLLDHLIKAAGLAMEPAEVLTRPNLAAYFASRRK